MRFFGTLENIVAKRVKITSPITSPSSIIYTILCFVANQHHPACSQCHLPPPTHHVQLLCLLHDGHCTAVVGVFQRVTVARSDSIAHLQQSECRPAGNDVADKDAATTFATTRNGNAETALVGLGKRKLILAEEGKDWMLLAGKWK